MFFLWTEVYTPMIIDPKATIDIVISTNDVTYINTSFRNGLLFIHTTKDTHTRIRKDLNLIFQSMVGIFFGQQSYFDSGRCSVAIVSKEVPEKVANFLLEVYGEKIEKFERHHNGCEPYDPNVSIRALAGCTPTAEAMDNRVLIQVCHL